MKQIILLLSFFAFATSSVHATDNPIPSAVLHSFYARFSGATDVSWEQNDEFTVAAFSVDGQKKYAYFNTRNELAILVDPIRVDQLPADLKSELANTYRHYTVTNLYKLQMTNGTTYSAVVENAKLKLFLNNIDSKWDESKRVRK